MGLQGDVFPTKPCLIECCGPLCPSVGKIPNFSADCCLCCFTALREPIAQCSGHVVRLQLPTATAYPASAWDSTALCQRGRGLRHRIRPAFSLLFTPCNLMSSIPRIRHARFIMWKLPALFLVLGSYHTDERSNGKSTALLHHCAVGRNGPVADLAFIEHTISSVTCVHFGPWRMRDHTATTSCHTYTLQGDSQHASLLVSGGLVHGLRLWWNVWQQMMLQRTRICCGPKRRKS